MRFKLATVLIASFVIAAFVGGVIAWRFSFFFLPFSWTGEPARLAELLRVRPGGTVADIGAGDGAMAIEMARRVGRDGVVYATELSAQQRAVMARRVAQANLPQVRVRGCNGRDAPARCMLRRHLSSRGGPLPDRSGPPCQ